MRALFLMLLVESLCQSAYCVELKEASHFVITSTVGTDCTKSQCPMSIEVINTSSTTCQASIPYGLLRIKGPNQRQVKFFISKCPSGTCEFDSNGGLTINEDNNNQASIQSCFPASCQMNDANSYNLSIIRYAPNVRWKAGAQDILCTAADPIIINDN